GVAYRRESLVLSQVTRPTLKGASRDKGRACAVRRRLGASAIDARGARRVSVGWSEPIVTLRITRERRRLHGVGQHGWLGLPSPRNFRHAPGTPCPGGPPVFPPEEFGAVHLYPRLQRSADYWGPSLAHP